MHSPITMSAWSTCQWRHSLADQTTRLHVARRTCQWCQTQNSRTISFRTLSGSSLNFEPTQRQRFTMSVSLALHNVCVARASQCLCRPLLSNGRGWGWLSREWLNAKARRTIAHLRPNPAPINVNDWVDAVNVIVLGAPPQNTCNRWHFGQHSNNRRVPCFQASQSSPTRVGLTGHGQMKFLPV